MYNREFLCWLAGFIQLSTQIDPKFHLSPLQRKVILNHAKLCQEVSQGKLTLYADYVLRFVLDEEKCGIESLSQYTLEQFKLLADQLTDNELCYYMQGYFEISRQSIWNRDCLDLVMNLFECNVTGLSNDLRAQYYQWRRELQGEDNSITKLYDCTVWMRKLNSIFMHSIDDEYEGFQDEETKKRLQAIHDGTTAQ